MRKTLPPQLLTLTQPHPMTTSLARPGCFHNQRVSCHCLSCTPAKAMQRLREQASVISGEPVSDSREDSHTNDTSNQSTHSKTPVVDVDMPDADAEPVLPAASGAVPVMSSELSLCVHPDLAEAAASQAGAAESQAWSPGPQPVCDQWASSSQAPDAW